MPCQQRPSSFSSGQITQTERIGRFGVFGSLAGWHNVGVLGLFRLIGRLRSTDHVAPTVLVVLVWAGIALSGGQEHAAGQSDRSEGVVTDWESYATAMAVVADSYAQLGLAADAERVRSELAAGQMLQSFDPPGSMRQDLSGVVSGTTLDVWRREQQVRSAYSTKVYRSARAALVDGETSTGLRLLRHAIAIDSDDVEVRQMLGYVRRGDQWKTVFQARMDDAGKVWHSRFGWLPAQHVERYEAGERYFRGRWVSAEDEARVRQHFEYAWETETEHFLVKTNVSQETAAALALRLESFHRYFERDYAKLFDSPRAAREYLKSPTRRAASKHEVHYFASKDEYVRRLSPKQQGVAISRGVYLPKDRVSYFFDDPEVVDPLDTLYHEVTHQLLFESDPKMRDVAAAGGYWAVEGFACYLESFHDPADGMLNAGPIAGDVDHDRIYWARYRGLVDGYYLPLQQFDRLGMRLFQSASDEEELRRRYSQSTGLTHFFLHYDNARYRDGFLQYLAGLYASSTRGPKSLDQIVGVPYALLDRQYRDYLAILERDAKIPSLQPLPSGTEPADTAPTGTEPTQEAAIAPASTTDQPVPAPRS